MKQIYMFNNSNMNVSGMERVKSRMNTVRPRYTHGSILSRICLVSLILLVVGGFSTKAWGASPVEFNSTKGTFLNSGVDNSYYGGKGTTVSDSESKKFSITQDSVEFRLLDWQNWDKQQSEAHFYISANSSKTIHWYPNNGFSVSVSEIDVNGKNTTWETGTWPFKKTHTGTAYFRKNNSASNVDSYSNSSWNTKTVNFSPAFGSEDYITVATQNDGDGNKGEYEVQWLKIYYSVTPPAPTLKNGSSVTRSQFVEGRSNNTVTLTDYFKPFNSGVSMSYVVKKKNGSGVYETINSGYTITSNVFKTTVVGEYQIFANSNATGAFIASASSPALAVTIEEVRPVTISVGSQELFVDGTTTMTITEQLNTTNPVVFSFDNNFFAYNESTHVLTAKNDANASFSSIEKSIHVTQESDGVYAAVNMNINFTIKKYDNAISCSWDSWSKNLNFDEEFGVTFSSNNDTGTSIDVTPAPVSDIATYDGANHKIVASHNIGSATWTVSQEEDYKYKAATSETISVSVDTIHNSSCDIYTNDNGIDVSSWGTSAQLTWTEPASKRLEFDACKSMATAVDDLEIYIKQGNSWGSSKFASIGVGELEKDKFKSFGFDLPEDAVGIYFVGGSYTRSVRNITVSRKRWFDIKNAAGTSSISSLDMPSRTLSGAATQNSFKLHYSTCASTIKLVSSSSHVTFANGQTTYSFTPDNTHLKEIVMNYTSDVAENTSYTITVYTIYERKTLTINVLTKDKLSTTIEYKGADSYSVNHANMNATELFQVRDENGDLVASPTITLSSNNTSAINTVSSNTAINFLCGADDVRITASYAGDATYYAAASNSGTFYHDIDVTKLTDTFTWNKAADENDKIHFWADSNIPSTIASVNASGTVTYSTTDGSKLSVTNDTELYAHTHGEVILTAISGGDCTYAAKNEGKYIVIDPCTHNIVWNQKFMGLMADEGGHIDSTIVLNAYAVDSLGNATGKAVSYSLEGTNVAEVATLEGCTLRIVGAGEAKLRVTTAADNKYAIASDTRKIIVRTYGQDCGTNLVDDPDEHHVSTYTNNPGKVYDWTGPADSIFVKVGKQSNITTQSLHIYTYDKNGNETNWQDWGVGSLSSDGDDKRLELPEGTVKIKFKGGGTQYKWYSNLIVTQKSYFTASTSSVTMSTVTGCETATGEFTLSYSDVPYVLLSQTNEDFTYEVWRDGKKLEGFDNTCGDWGVYTIKFFYTPKVGGAYSNTVTLSTVNKTPQVITLSGTANAPARTIVWDIPSGNTITATQSLDLTAYAQTACENPAGSVEYSYTATVDGAATIEGNHITFNKAATVTVTANTVASAMYGNAIPVDKVWTVGKVGTQMRRLPTITSTITYGDTKSVVTYDNDSWCAEDVLSHDSVPGTIAYVGPDNFTAAGPQELTFNFTPSDLSVYDAQPFTVQVTVQKMAALEVDVPLSICAGRSETYRGTEYSVAGTYPVNAEGDNRDTVYNVIVTVLQPTTGTDSKTITYGENESWHDTDLSGYTAGEHEVEYHTTNAVGCDSTVTLSLTVNKATPTLSWETAPAELAYNATDVVYAATSTSNEGDITYSITSGSEYAEINANTGVLTNIVPGHNITVQATQAVSTNYNAPVAITVNVTIAAIPTNTFTNAHGDNDWQNDENWSNGVPAGEAPNVIVSGALSINESITVGNLTIENTGSIAVITGGTLTVNGTSEYREAGYGDIHVLDDGALALGESANLKVRNFTLDAKLGDNDSNPAASGQVSGDEKLDVNGDAYFKMSFDISGQITYGWYDFTVPFEVDAMNGVFDENGVQIVFGTDYIIMNHSEEKCARNQKAWNTFKGTLEPGLIYSITFEETKTWNTFLFKKKAGSELVNDSTYTPDYSSTIGESQYRGWNGFGNGTLQHRELTDLSGISKVQMYNHTENRYDVVDNAEWNTKALAVGTAFSIQVSSEQSIVLKTADAEKPLRAPGRDARTVEEFYLTLSEETGKTADRLWVSASEEATGEYTIGHDLLKMGTPTSAKVAQMWTTRDNMKLCDIEMPLTSNKANTNLSLYAPKAGVYELAIQRAPADATLYLTQNNRVIWNLSMSPYDLDLTKGTTEGYGLRIVAQTPQVTTDIENGGLLNGADGVRKVLIDDKIYIVTPEGKMYDIIGKGVNF